MISCTPLRGIKEVTPGDDLAAELAGAADLRDGDILVVTSKVVSKAEGRLARGERADFLEQETASPVARRGATRIVRTRHGLVMAAAGIDASNTAPGTVVLLPMDPDASARGLREAFAARGANVGVVVSDTSGRAWRTGQTDIAIGAAGVLVLDDHTGRTDGYGNPLSVTAPAIVDEVAAMAELATGKLGNAPAALVRGLDRFVLPAGADGPGAGALVREPAQDMFALGTREAVLHALLGTRPEAFGAPAAAEELVEALAVLVPGAAAERRAGGVLLELRPADASRHEACLVRLEALAHAYGWRLERDASPAAPAAERVASPAAAVRFRPATP